MDSKLFRPRNLFKQNTINRSAITKKSFSQIPKSTINYTDTVPSLLQKYDKETEAINLKKVNKKFHITILMCCLMLLMVSEYYLNNF